MLACQHVCMCWLIISNSLCRNRHITTRHYARIVKAWVSLTGLDPNDYGTHSLRHPQSHTNLSTDEEFKSRSTIAWV